MTVLLKKISRYLKPLKHLSAAYLFGSLATGKNHSESDVDIALLFHPKKTPSVVEIQDMQVELEGILKRPVDLILLNQANPILAHQVLKKGQRILLNDKSHFSEFFARHITDYDDLKKVRSIIEKRWIAGAVHG